MSADNRKTIQIQARIDKGLLFRPGYVIGAMKFREGTRLRGVLISSIKILKSTQDLPSQVRLAPGNWGEIRVE